MQNRFNEHWDGIVRNRQTPLCEEHYRRARDVMMVIPPKWFYDMLFKRLKSRKNLLFNQIQAERAMEQIFGSPRNNTDRTDMEQVLVMAERRYMLLMGFKESVGESVGVIGEYYEMQNPTLESVIAYIKRAVRGHKTDKSDLEYAIDDLEKVGRALEAILKKAKAKGK